MIEILFIYLVSSNPTSKLTTSPACDKIQSVEDSLLKTLLTQKKPIKIEMQSDNIEQDPSNKFICKRKLQFNIVGDDTKIIEVNITLQNQDTNEQQQIIEKSFFYSFESILISDTAQYQQLNFHKKIEIDDMIANFQNYILQINLDILSIDQIDSQLNEQGYNLITIIPQYKLSDQVDGDFLDKILLIEQKNKEENVDKSVVNKDKVVKDVDVVNEDVDDVVNKDVNEVNEEDTETDENKLKFFQLKKSNDNKFQYIYKEKQELIIYQLKISLMDSKNYKIELKGDKNIQDFYSKKYGADLSLFKTINQRKVEMKLNVDIKDYKFLQPYENDINFPLSLLISFNYLKKLGMIYVEDFKDVDIGFTEWIYHEQDMEKYYGTFHEDFRVDHVNDTKILTDIDFLFKFNEFLVQFFKYNYNYFNFVFGIKEIKRKILFKFFHHGDYLFIKIQGNYFNSEHLIPLNSKQYFVKIFQEIIKNNILHYKELILNADQEKENKEISKDNLEKEILSINFNVCSESKKVGNKFQLMFEQEGDIKCENEKKIDIKDCKDKVYKFKAIQIEEVDDKFNITIFSNKSNIFQTNYLIEKQYPVNKLKLIEKNIKRMLCDGKIGFEKQNEKLNKSLSEIFNKQNNIDSEKAQLTDILKENKTDLKLKKDTLETTPNELAEKKQLDDLELEKNKKLTKGFKERLLQKNNKKLQNMYNNILKKSNFLYRQLIYQ